MSQNNNLNYEGIKSLLCDLYDSFGFSRYKMSKFEEYDLYAKNRDFWESTGIITFNDHNGRLMALKPDITLSIVKNVKTSPGSIRKLYYYENVYRTTRDSDSFREITQAGLEALGDIDDYCIYEVIKLAAKTLETIGRRFILEVSDISLLCDFLESIGIARRAQSRFLSLIGEKNQHELNAACKEAGVTGENAGLIRELIGIHGPVAECLQRVMELLDGHVNQETLFRYKDIMTALAAREQGGNIVIDFSIVNDTKYYNGFVFKGYIEGIPASVLSGGQYDILLKRMHKDSGALGFALYMDALESLFYTREEYDVDTLLIYGEGNSISEIESQVKSLATKGESVMVQKAVPAGIKYRKLLDLSE